MKYVPSIPSGSVLSGGPNSVYAEDAFGIDEEIFELGIPILGICYGMQLLTHKLGGKVVPAGEAGNREYGQSTLRLRAQSELFAGTPEEQVVLMSHGDAVTEIQKVSILLLTQWIAHSLRWKILRKLLWYPIPPRSSSHCIW